MENKNSPEPNIGALKALIDTTVTSVEATSFVLADNKFTWTDAVHLVPVFPTVPKLISEMNDFLIEIKTLTPEGKQQLVEYIREKVQDDTPGSEDLEEFLESILALPALYASSVNLFNKIKKQKPTFSPDGNPS